MTGGPRIPVAAAAAAAWIILAGFVWAVVGTGGLAVMAVLGPLAAIWPLAALGRHEAACEDARARLRAEVEGLRGDLRRLVRARPQDEAPSSPAPSAPEPAPPPEPEEPATPRRRPSPLEPEAFVRALNFPDDADDADGFTALRRALADPQSRKLVQASQDVLTLLSQNGVFMDDLQLRPASAAVWRRFAGGVRGEGVADVKGVDDAEAMELAQARMARDTIFRDAVQHFLRQFDLALQRFVADASDDQIALFGQTRTAMAYMLLARAAKVLE